MILKDSLAKTALLPVRFKDGKFINYLTQEEVCGIDEGALCDLVVDAYRITDPELLALLNDETDTELFPEGEMLYADVSEKEIPENFSKFATSSANISIGANGKFVAIHLKTPLKMMFRGTKQPALFDCGCEIPSLEETAKSLNHAYTLISTAFEPHRRSHTGNVFKKVFYKCRSKDYRNGSWIPLEELRLAKLQEYFNQLSARYKEQKKSRLIKAVTNPNALLLDTNFNEAGVQLTGFYVEGGIKDFASCARQIVEDVGTDIKPYLKNFYIALRDFPGFDTSGMDSTAEVEAFDLETLNTSANTRITDGK